MGEPRPAAGVEPGLLAASLAMALLLMAFGALATLGGALLLRLLSGIRIMTAISQAAAATFFMMFLARIPRPLWSGRNRLLLFNKVL